VLQQGFSVAETCRQLKEPEAFEKTRRPSMNRSSTFVFNKTRVDSRWLSCGGRVAPRYRAALASRRAWPL